MEPQIRAICRELMRDAAERGEVEFVHDVTAGLPTRVIGQLMGLPEKDWGHIHELAERNTSTQDPDLAGEDDYSGSIEMAMYAIEFAADRRSQPPREDLTTLILESEFAGAPMTDVDFGSFFVQLVTAGNDTTKTMLSSGLHALLQHPDQLAELRADPRLMPGAVEEILRWANPLHYFRRTTTADTELHGVDHSRRRQGGDVLHVRQPRRGRLRRLAGLRHPPPPQSRTWRSGSPSTSVSGCTWPGSRAGSSSRSCSPASARSSSRATRCGCART